MKRSFINFQKLTAMVLAGGLMAACTDDPTPNPAPGPDPEAENRWITVAAAKMGDNPGDGNGGTLIYSLTSEEARDPSVSIAPFDNGFIVPSNRTARLQSSEDGNTMFNISYGGDTGGNYSKYTVAGGQNFAQTGTSVSIAPYVGSAPRWIKLFDGDKTGSAVTVATEHQFATDGTYLRTESTIGVVTLDLVNSSIIEVQESVVRLR